MCTQQNIKNPSNRPSVPSSHSKHGALCPSTIAPSLHASASVRIYIRVRSFKLTPDDNFQDSAPLCFWGSYVQDSADMSLRGLCDVSKRLSLYSHKPTIRLYPFKVIYMASVLFHPLTRTHFTQLTCYLDTFQNEGKVPWKVGWGGVGGKLPFHLYV